MTQDQELRWILRRVRTRWMALRACGATGRAAAGAAGALLLALAVDRWLAPVGAPLLALAGIAGASVLVLAAHSLWPLRRVPGDGQVARYIEERCPELEDRVASAADAASRPVPAGFRSLLLADALGRARQIDLERVISRASLRRAGVRGAAAGLALVVTGLLAVEPGRRVARTASFYFFPPVITVDVAPGDVRLPAGEPLQIRVMVHGATDVSPVDPVIRLVNETATHDAPMEPSGGEYVFDIPAVAGSFTYSIGAGPVRTRAFRVTALHPPRVRRIDVHYEYPAFTGLPPRLERDGGDVYAPAGTEVELRVHADGAVRHGALVMRGGPPVELEAGPDETLAARLTVAQDGSYRVALSDHDGLENPGDTEYFIRVMDDRPPDVRILRPATDRQVTPVEEVVIEARAEDDYGIERFELVYGVGGQRERAIPLQGGGSRQVRTGSHVLRLEELDLQPGEFITYYARARDAGRGRRSSVARSDIYFLEVRPFEEEFVAAQSQAMAGAGGSAFDDLVAAQKEIIVASWKLERRTAAGRSAEDVGAVARAQGELRSRALQAAAQFRPRDLRRPFRPEPAPDAPENPMSRAAEAMGRAQASLEALDIGSALPHEMDALGELLKAQAEIQRRQVARQQASGGGGAGRPGHDLSTLFDRELQRQHQTMYETREPADRTPEHQESEALARVRELARRQDDLARRQQELAGAGLSQEELKRQLERLTREQSELRQQVEALARQLSESRQGGQPPPEGGEGGGGQHGGDARARAIAEDMQRAASDLRRQDLEGASARGSRALERLRDLERQLQGASPDERRRALGELQLEAEQVADAQRGIAREAGRLEEEGASGDARRRMAGDKDRLAERLDNLERTLSQLASQAPDRERQQLDEAGRELAGGRLGEQMRESAERWREVGTRAGRLSDTEEALARSLERVAEHVAAARGTSQDAESRKLSEQLARARELREQLGELQRQLDRLGRAGRESTAEPGRRDGPRGGGDQGSADLARLEQEYREQLRRAREIMEQMAGENPDLGRRLSEFQGWSSAPSAPGTEAFKQDYARWEVLRDGLASALDSYESALSQRIAEERARDRLHTGLDGRTPEEYRRMVARYFEALAKKAPPPP